MQCHLQQILWQPCCQAGRSMCYQKKLLNSPSSKLKFVLRKVLQNLDSSADRSIISLSGISLSGDTSRVPLAHRLKTFMRVMPVTLLKFGMGGCPTGRAAPLRRNRSPMQRSIHSAADAWQGMQQCGKGQGNPCLMSQLGCMRASRQASWNDGQD